MMLLFITLLSLNSVLTDDTVTDPVITSWTKADGTTGYSDILANVETIQYSTDYVYIQGSGIPSYTIGPWKKNNASDQSFLFKIPRNPTVKSTKTSTTLGHIGVYINGVAAYNPKDGYSYNSTGVWEQIAYYWEYSTFDSCLGHANAKGEYHHHITPICLYDSTANTTHSSLIGYAFDGYPIYGPFGYSSANDSSSSIKRLSSSYTTRSITTRTTLSNGTTLSSDYYGPDVSSSYPLGSYVQDYEYVSDLGDLDVYNGRWCATPEYPSGTYAYFISTDSSGTPVYPFIIGPYYYGSPVTANLLSRTVTISETVSTYFSYSS